MGKCSYPVKKIYISFNYLILKCTFINSVNINKRLIYAKYMVLWEITILEAEEIMFSFVLNMSIDGVTLS